MSSPTTIQHMKPPTPPECISDDEPPPPPPDESSIHLTEGEPHALIKDMIDANPREFEARVLACLLGRPDFLALVLPVLCVNPKPDKFTVDDNWQDDFTQYEFNALFRCLRKHFEIAGGKCEGISRDFVRSALTHGAKNLEDISEDEITGALEDYDTIRGLDLNESMSMVEQGFIHWLQKRRMTVCFAETTAGDTWSSGPVIDALQLQLAPVKALAQPPGERFQAFGSAPPPEPTNVIKSGFRACDESLGGFAKQELTLAIAPSGGGKTVLGTQLAGAFAQKGYKVLFITTEQPPHELEPRIVSNFCNILFSRIKAGVVERALQPEELKRYQRLREVLAANLHFADWGRDRSRSIAADLNAEIKAFIKSHGRLDVLIFDYIGGALGAIHGNDQHALRMTMQSTGETLADLARQHHLVVIACAQAGIASSRNKKRIGQEDIAECKGLGRAATNVIGISALPDTSDEEGSSYAAIQYLHVSKARKSAGGCRSFIRDFQYQRLKDL